MDLTADLSVAKW